MKQKRDLVLSVSCFFLAFLLMMVWSGRQEENLAKRIAPEILRFHVLANSNSREDQSLKLGVRTLLLDSIYEEMGTSASIEETRNYIKTHSTELEKTAETYMSTQGYDYSAHMELTTCYFPTKTYGDMVFPCGNYEAARITIGSGSGRNWWCVLYPPLCFVDSAYAVVPDTSKKILEANLGRQDYESLLKPRLTPPDGDVKNKQAAVPAKIQVKVKLKFVELLNLHR